MTRMERSLASNVRIIAGNPDLARRWAKLIASAATDVRLVDGHVGEEGRVEVILTDGNPQTPAWPGRSGEHLDDNMAGIVCIGGQGRADVRLPDNATDREILLACSLLGEVVRLRRRLAAESQAARRAAHEALTDPLTGLPNRRAWEQALTGELAAVGARRTVCLAILDLDHFKRINDAQGHAAGDAALCAAAAALVGGLRDGDLVARIGGDEFGLLIPVPDRRVAEVVVERVRCRVNAALSEAGRQGATASAGFCVVPSSDTFSTSPQRLMHAADEALRAAKSLGRNRSVGSNSV